MVMEQYYFLFFLGLIWIIFAVVQDWRKTEVSNWLNYSLIAFALAYRAFYSVNVSDYSFLLFGVYGFILFFIVGNLFYYSRVFAGGDTKLLYGIGCILPAQSYSEVLFSGIFFIFLLFIAGLLYSLIYSVFLAKKNYKVFQSSWKEYFVSFKNYLFIFILLGVVLLIFGAQIRLFGIYFILVPFLYIYLRAVDSSMIKLTKPKDLMEGDWVEKDIRIGSKVIRKSIHGLSWKEIDLLRKHHKSVLVKQGIPFTPAFLIAFLFMVSFYLFSKYSFLGILQGFLA